MSLAMSQLDLLQNVISVQQTASFSVVLKLNKKCSFQVCLTLSGHEPYVDTCYHCLKGNMSLKSIKNLCV